MRHRGIRGSHDWTSGALTKQEFWFRQLFVANWPIACTTWEPDIKYWFWVYLRTLTARRSSVVTVRPAPHPHCSKSRLSSWDEVKMRCRFTTLVLIKKKGDNFFFFFFALDMQSSTSPRVPFILCPATTKKKLLCFLVVVTVSVFTGGVSPCATLSDRQTSRLCGRYQLLCLEMGSIHWLIVPAVVYGAIIFMSTVSHGCHWQ